MFRKTFATPALAREALRRSDILRAGGLRTPRAWPGAGAHEVFFEQVDGENRFGLLAGVPIDTLLVPLATLHGLSVPGIPRFDPLARITPRLGPETPRWPADSLARLTDGLPRGNALLHGDFHVGQMIRDGSGAIWLVDLDDLAIGPPEADLGNFAAHLATSSEACGGTPGDGSLTHWRDAVLSAWRRLDRACDAAAFDRFLALALIRRHLKLREAGRPDFGDMIARAVSVP